MAGGDWIRYPLLYGIPFLYFEISAANARKGKRSREIIDDIGEINMFGFLKKKETKKDHYEMKATADGKVIPMTEAKDPVFSSCALGNGIVVCPTGNVVVAPADGKVTVTMEGSNHAVGMELEGGIEILIHIGVDTVELNGEGFTPLVKMGDKVKAGTELIRFDREALEAKGYCMEVMQIVMDGETAAKVQYTTGMDAVAGQTVVANW
jgi:PTS system D-glucosamine-specific IIC component